MNTAESGVASTPPLTDPPAALLEAAALLKTLSEDDAIYSRESTGVIVPRLVSLGFVHPLISGFQTRTSMLELLVSKSGTVEHA